MAGDSNQLPAAVALPSDRLWVDPRWLATALYTQVTDYTSPGPGLQIILQPNFDRWAVGFSLGPFGGAGSRVGPWLDVTPITGVALADGVLLWYDQQHYGPVVGGAWGVSAILGAQVRVTEVIRRTRFR